MRVYRFEVVVEQEPDDEVYAAHIPTLTGSVSSGKTFEELVRSFTSHVFVEDRQSGTPLTHWHEGRQLAIT